MAYRYNIDFSDAERALIEAYRMKRGHKATATAVRELIELGLEATAKADARALAVREVWVIDKDGARLDLIRPRSGFRWYFPQAVEYVSAHVLRDGEPEQRGLPKLALSNGSGFAISGDYLEIEP